MYMFVSMRVHQESCLNMFYAVLNATSNTHCTEDRKWLSWLDAHGKGLCGGIKVGLNVALPWTTGKPEFTWTPPPLLCDRLFPMMLMTLLELYNATLLGLLNKPAPEKVVPNHPSSPWISQADIKTKKARRHAEWKKWKTSFVSSH